MSVPERYDTEAETADWTPDEARQLYAQVASDGDRRVARAMGWDARPLDARILKWVCFQCRLDEDAPGALGRMAFPGRPGAPPWADGHRWVALSRTDAARRFDVKEEQARAALRRLVEEGLLRKRNARFRGHNTCWYRPDATRLAAFYCPDGDCAEIIEFRPRHLVAAPDDPQRSPSESPTRSNPSLSSPSSLSSKAFAFKEEGSTRVTRERGTEFGRRRRNLDRRGRASAAQSCGEGVPVGLRCGGDVVVVAGRRSGRAAMR